MIMSANSSRIRRDTVEYRPVPKLRYTPFWLRQNGVERTVHQRWTVLTLSVYLNFGTLRYRNSHSRIASKTFGTEFPAFWREILFARPVLLNKNHQIVSISTNAVAIAANCCAIRSSRAIRNLYSSVITT